MRNRRFCLGIMTAKFTLGKAVGTTLKEAVSAIFLRAGLTLRSL